MGKVNIDLDLSKNNSIENVNNEESKKKISLDDSYSSLPQKIILEMLIKTIPVLTYISHL
ncbi:hypothetical protein [Providencia rettgeri]|uniref:hypothetical protein n=1 Tax=Providencia rettgeri TaxID=587 RepID=UPI002362B5FF|nr:hypothetical protein [Providencia rettgeri]